MLFRPGCNGNDVVIYNFNDGAYVSTIFEVIYYYVVASATTAVEFMFNYVVIVSIDVDNFFFTIKNVDYYITN